MTKCDQLKAENATLRRKLEWYNTHCVAVLSDTQVPDPMHHGVAGTATGIINYREALQETEKRAVAAKAECEALHEQLRELKRGLRNNNSDFELAFIDAYLDKFRNLTARAEAAEAERDRLKQELDALKAERD